VDACFERRGTALGSETPAALTTAFYEDQTLQGRWRAYLEGGTILAPPPSRFDEVGGAIIRFLGPVRTSIVAGAPFGTTWPPGGPWQ
jgi:hypothetical protein